MQLAPSPRPAARLEERVALAVRALKAVAVDRDMTVLATAQLPRHNAARPDPRPTLDDLGGMGAIKQNADLVLAIYREEMYRSASSRTQRGRPPPPRCDIPQDHWGNKTG